jgi:hypothetical protein
MYCSRRDGTRKGQEKRDPPLRRYTKLKNGNGTKERGCAQGGREGQGEEGQGRGDRTAPWIDRGTGLNNAFLPPTTRFFLQQRVSSSNNAFLPPTTRFFPQQRVSSPNNAFLPPTTRFFLQQRVSSSNNDWLESGNT